MVNKINHKKEIFKLQHDHINKDLENSNFYIDNHKIDILLITAVASILGIFVVMFEYVNTLIYKY